MATDIKQIPMMVIPSGNRQSSSPSSSQRSNAANIGALYYDSSTGRIMNMNADGSVRDVNMNDDGLQLSSNVNTLNTNTNLNNTQQYKPLNQRAIDIATKL